LGLLRGCEIDAAVDEGGFAILLADVILDTGHQRFEEVCGFVDVLFPAERLEVDAQITHRVEDL
jgi:hypothetical protein